MTQVERATRNPEARRLFQQERLILEVTERICQLMEDQTVSRKELAERLGKSKAYVTQLLDGRANMTLRTISDVFLALGQAVAIQTVALEATVRPTMIGAKQDAQWRSPWNWPVCGSFPIRQIQVAAA